jgi:hypothetical protein
MRIVTYTNAYNLVILSKTRACRLLSVDLSGRFLLTPAGQANEQTILLPSIHFCSIYDKNELLPVGVK